MLKAERKRSRVGGGHGERGEGVLAKKYLRVKIVDKARRARECQEKLQENDKTNAPFSLTFTNLTFYVIFVPRGDVAWTWTCPLPSAPSTPRCCEAFAGRAPRAM